MSRCGIIPYTIVNDGTKNVLHFLLGRDTRSGDLGDFGGGVKDREMALHTAMREFKEETSELFGEDMYKDINRLATKITLVEHSSIPSQKQDSPQCEGKAISDYRHQFEKRTTSQDVRSVPGTSPPKEKPLHDPSHSVRSMAIIFLPVSPEWINKAKPYFNRSSISNIEVDDIVWVDEHMFSILVNKKKYSKQAPPPMRLWKKVQKFLYGKVNSFLYNLLKSSFVLI